MSFPPGRPIVLLAVSLALAMAACGREQPPPDPRLHPEAVLALLDVVDLVVEKNPQHDQLRRTLNALPQFERDRRVAALVARNAGDPAIQQAIDGFLATPAMTIYLQRFPNVSAGDIRRSLEGIPLVVVDAPGNIAQAYDTMVPIREELRRWVSQLAQRIDLPRAGAEAARWLPPGHGPPPDMFLVFDANAGSFTADSRGFYNLYSDIVQDLPRGQAPDLERLAEMERVIAHEMQHVMAEPLFAAAARQGESWQKQRMDQVIRGLVSEGAAIHCNPPEGLRREIWEDPFTLTNLMADLNLTFLALAEGRMDEATFEDWFRNSFHGRARDLMRQSLARKHAAAEVGELMLTRASLRPDLIHALGWHMVATISRRGTDPEAVRRLLRDPYALLATYSAATPPSGLRIDPRLLQP